jgi:hypothetical protein
VQEQAKFSSFKAAPVRITGSPFRPERSKMPLTEVMLLLLLRMLMSRATLRRWLCLGGSDGVSQVTPFELNTDKRKEDREEFEMKKFERVRSMDCAKVGGRAGCW